MKYAKIAVDAANFCFDIEFTYIIPDEVKSAVKKGCRVVVPFGSGSRKSLGIVFDLTDYADGKKLKNIVSVLDNEPLLSDEMLDVARFMKNRYFCTLYEAARAMLPAGINHRIVKSYAANTDADPSAVEKLEKNEKELYQFLVKRGTYVRQDLIFTNLAMVQDTSLLEHLEKKGLIFSQSDAVKNLGELTTRMVRLIPDAEAKKPTAKQKEIIDLLTDLGSASVKELCYFTGYTPAVINAIVKNGTAEYFDCQVDYFAGISETDGERTPISLTDEQNEAFTKLKNLAFSGKRATSLLYGVTGSGKTSVYMKVMDEVIDSGRNILLLVPEISLTPQALSIFCKRYGRNVAVFHSALSVRERSEQWKKVKNGKAKIVIGTRSAIFAPFDNLGLIIIDEEQEHTYKSEQTPRYDAVEVAKCRAAKNNCLLVLASATPRVESYASAKNGKYELSKISHRYGKAEMPEVITVDMRTAEKMPGCSEISKELYEALKANLDSGRQSILLINRRGFNTFAVCDSCSQVITCPNCSISMTYHSANKRLLCHYCGYSVPFTQECPECHEQSVRYAGFGTQKIEDELSSLLPDVRILRMDADTTSAKDSHEKLLGAFERGEYDILLGTQMVAKGLDFPNVTLVGVVSVDQQLYNDDFRSLEKTFSLLTQVVGRSGRGNSKGIAIIQTLTPENEIIRLAAAQDYDAFYNTEIRIRKGMTYPPYCDLCVVGFTGSEEITVKAAALETVRLVRELTAGKYSNQKIIVLGPVPARVSKLGGKFRYRIIIKCRNTPELREMITEILIKLNTDKRFRSVGTYADMNPDAVL